MLSLTKAILAKAHNSMMPPSGGTAMVRMMDATSHTMWDLPKAGADEAVALGAEALKGFLPLARVSLAVLRLELSLDGVDWFCLDGWAGGKTVWVAAVALSLACCAASIFSKYTTKSPRGGSW